jgi:hypothetical protein
MGILSPASTPRWLFDSLDCHQRQIILAGIPAVSGHLRNTGMYKFLTDAAPSTDYFKDIADAEFLPVHIPSFGNTIGIQAEDLPLQLQPFTTENLRCKIAERQAGRIKGAYDSPCASKGASVRIADFDPSASARRKQEWQNG